MHVSIFIGKTEPAQLYANASSVFRFLLLKKKAILRPQPLADILKCTCTIYISIAGFLSSKWTRTTTVCRGSKWGGGTCRLSVKIFDLCRYSVKIFDFVGKSQLIIKKRMLNINVCYKNYLVLRLCASYV